MAAESGRKLLIKRSTDGGTTYNTIACLRTKSFTIANEAIDITDDCSGAWRELLAEPGNRTIDISASGLSKDDTITALVVTDTASVVLEDIQIELPSGATIDGSFFITSYAQTGEYQDAVTFDLEMQSSGAPTFTAA